LASITGVQIAFLSASPAYQAPAELDLASRQIGLVATDGQAGKFRIGDVVWPSIRDLGIV